MSRYRAPERLQRGSLAEQVLILVAHLGSCTLDEVAVALTSRDRVALRAWLADHERLAPRWGASSLRQVLRRACRRVLVPTYTPYALRRALAGRLRLAGKPVTCWTILAAYPAHRTPGKPRRLVGRLLNHTPDGKAIMVYGGRGVRGLDGGTIVVAR